MKRIALALAAVAALSTAVPARATTFITDYRIGGPPNGTFTLGYDDNTSVFSLLALNLIVGGTTFDPLNAGLVQAGPDVTIGGNASGVTVLAPSGDDFKFHFEPGPGGTFSSFFDVFFEIRPGDSFFATIEPMPEPSSWALLAAGIGSLVGLRRSRRNSS